MPGVKRRRTAKANTSPRKQPKVEHNHRQSSPVSPEEHDEAAATPEGLEILQHITLSKLSRKRHIPQVGNHDIHQKVHSLLSSTVLSGESNSMLLIGPHGTGKSKAVNDSLDNLSKEHSEAFLVVRLDGLIEGDDKLALREIMRQLGKQMSEEDEAANEAVKNYSDTLTTLIATLSSHQPDNAAASGAPGEQQSVTRSVIFILDTFDAFTLHPRQTLLYNLLDIAQSSSRRTPICVLGLTTKVNVVDMLEKRVKSRFSHRTSFFRPAVSLDDFTLIVRAALEVKTEELSRDEREKLQQHGGLEANLQKWNSSMTSLLQRDNISHSLASTFCTTKSIPEALTSLIFPIADIDTVAVSNNSTTSTSTPAPIAPSRTQTQSLKPPDSHLHILPQLPLLALTLLLTAARLEVIHSSDTMNFNIVYDEYLTLTSRQRALAFSSGAGSGAGSFSLSTSTCDNALSTPSKGGGVRIWSQGMCMEMWQLLVDEGLLIPVNGRVVGGSRKVEKTEMVRVDVALEEVRDVVVRMGERGLEGWCRL